MLKKFVACSALVVVAACQTIGPPVPPEEATAVIRAASSHCIAQTSVSSIVDPTKNRPLENLVVMSIRYGADGWKRADVATEGWRDDIFINDVTGKVVCGNKNWQKSGIQFDPIEATSTPRPIAKASDRKGNSKNVTRPVAVKWEGVSKLIAGSVTFTNSSEGTLSAILPANQGNCKGTFSSNTKSWAIACTNGLAASGSFTPYGAGKGASGEGIDALGRKVSYAVGGASPAPNDSHAAPDRPFSNLSNDWVCGNALGTDYIWKDSPAADEARRRGFSLKDCQRIIGVNR